MLIDFPQKLAGSVLWSNMEQNETRDDKIYWLFFLMHPSRHADARASVVVLFVPDEQIPSSFPLVAITTDLSLKGLGASWDMPHFWLVGCMTMRSHQYSWALGILWSMKSLDVQAGGHGHYPLQQQVSSGMYILWEAGMHSYIPAHGVSLLSPSFHGSLSWVGNANIEA